MWVAAQHAKTGMKQRLGKGCASGSDSIVRDSADWLGVEMAAQHGCMPAGWERQKARSCRLIGRNSEEWKDLKIGLS